MKREGLMIVRGVTARDGQGVGPAEMGRKVRAMTNSSDTFVLCRSDEDDGGWSLHAPGSTDEDIACGDAPYLVSGAAEELPSGEWDRPNAADYAAAQAEYERRQA